MKWLDRVLKGDRLGLHLAANIFIATVILWLVLRRAAGLNPIWAISSMIASVDPQVHQALKTFRGRIANSLLGCATGLLVLLIGGPSEWKLPIAMSLTALLSTYVIRVQVMWRQAPITAAIVIASMLETHSKTNALELGLRRVGEVIFGCVLGLMVTWLMSKIWPVPPPIKEK